MADRQVGISVKTTVNDSQLRSLKDNFRGVTRGMGNDMDELSIRTQKYMENLRRAQEIGATPAYRQQLRQQQLELKQSIDVRLREIRREGDEAVAQINRQILATKRFVYERQQILKQSGIADDERSRLSQEISQQQAELRRLQLERQQVLQAQRERMVPAGQLRERVESTGGTLRELPSTMLGGAGAKLGSLLKTGAVLFGIGSITQQMAAGMQQAITTDIELGDLSKRVKEAKETYDDFRLRILQVGDALGYTNEEMRELGRQAAAMVGARDLQTTLQTAAGFARSYGLQAPFVTDMLGMMFRAGVTGGVTAQMRPQEFAAMLSEAIGSGRMAGREEELIQSIENLVAATQRTLVTPPNVQAMFEVMTTLNQSGIQGLTGERGAQLLNQLSQGIMQPGGGEAGDMFMFQALNAGGAGLEYFKYRLLQEQGAFGTMEDVNKMIPGAFTPEQIEKYGKRTNIEAVMEHLAAQGLPLPVEAEIASNLLGWSRSQYIGFRGATMKDGQFQVEHFGAMQQLLGERDINKYIGAFPLLDRLTRAQKPEDLAPIIEELKQQQGVKLPENFSELSFKEQKQALVDAMEGINIKTPGDESRKAMADLQKELEKLNRNFVPLLNSLKENLANLVNLLDPGAGGRSTALTDLGKSALGVPGLMADLAASGPAGLLADVGIGYGLYKLGRGGWSAGKKAIEMGKKAAPWLQRGAQVAKEGAGKAAGAAGKAAGTAAEAAGKGAKAAAPWLSRIAGAAALTLGELSPWLGVEGARRSDLEMAISVREKLANGTPLSEEEQEWWSRLEQNLKRNYKTEDSVEALDQFIAYLSGMGITNWGIEMSPEMKKRSEEINRKQQEESAAYARKWWGDRLEGVKRFFGSGSYELQGDFFSARQQTGMYMPASWSAGKASMLGDFSLMPYNSAMQAPITNVPWYGGIPPQIKTLPYFFNQVPGSGITLASFGAGQSLKSGGLFGGDIMPVDGIITSLFGMREDPFTKEKRFHEGVDIAAPEGAPVRSTTMGIVSKVIADARAGGAAGKYIEITTPDGRTVRYLHLSGINVQMGQAVRPGDIIGQVGSTGRATGPHLHYEVRAGGRAINPLGQNMLASSGGVILAGGVTNAAQNFAPNLMGQLNPSEAADQAMYYYRAKYAQEVQDLMSLGYLGFSGATGSPVSYGSYPSSGNTFTASVERWRSTVNQIAAKYGVNPDEIMQIIQAESGGNPRAVSSAGAKGLMQIMEEYHAINNPFDPVENIQVGTRFYAGLLQEFGGDRAAALAAYNAGAGRVHQAMGRAGTDNFAAYERYLPEETRKYVRGIMAMGSPVQQAGVSAQTVSTMGTGGVIPAQLMRQSLAVTFDPVRVRLDLPGGQTQEVAVQPRLKDPFQGVNYSVLT
ncbi:MAG: peptidoglycan DD-metalloendopeptidase family protein [Firmicutes bacterium]|nr:peptidoglycan DD-metalloendopeptidase family protein [Bacillota bacterium]